MLSDDSTCTINRMYTPKYGTELAVSFSNGQQMYFVRIKNNKFMLKFSA